MEIKIIVVLTLLYFRGCWALHSISMTIIHAALSNSVLGITLYINIFIQLMATSMSPTDVTYVEIR